MPGRDFDPATSAVIRKAKPHEWRSALELVLSAEGAADREEQVNDWLTQPDTAESLAGLWIAEFDGRIAGAVLAKRLAGRYATVWPAQTSVGVPRPVADRLISDVVDWLAQGETRSAQALLPVEPGPEHEQLAGNGFAHVADLLMQISVLDGRAVVAAGEPPAAPFELVAFESRLRPRLRRVVEQTYQGSLDCPVLEAAREVDDVLDGYAVNGNCGTSGWHLVTRDGVDVGCLLLANDTRHRYAELVYMGLVPQVRGKGWGRELVRCAQRMALDAGLRRVALAVDAANAPAIAIYEAAGFTTWAKRSVYFRRIERR